MHPHRKLPPTLPLSASLFILALLTACLSGRADSLAVKGIVYENVIVRSTTPSHLILSHDGGIAQVALADLPSGWQDRLGFDPAVAARHQARVEAQARQDLLRRQSARPTEPATPAGYERLRPEIDFREGKPSSLTRAKDQGGRPVNDIYAIVTALEYAYAMKNREPTPLSEEYVLWAVLQTYPDLAIGRGFHLNAIIKAIQIHGVCREDLFANRTVRPINEVEPPPLAAINDAAQRRNLQAVLIPAAGKQSIAQILFNLNQNRPIVALLRWPHANTLRQSSTLRAQVPLEGAAHAVTLIGYRTDPLNPEAVVLLFRNSFGPRWGLAGHGYIALDYLDKHYLGGFAVDLYEGNNPAAVRERVARSTKPDR